MKLRPDVLKSTQERLSDHWLAIGRPEGRGDVEVILGSKKHILTSQLGHGRNVYAIR